MWKLLFQYSLFGVVVHSGSMQGGHYVAYTKVRPSRISQEVKTDEETKSEDGKKVKFGIFQFFDILF